MVFTIGQAILSPRDGSRAIVQIEAKMEALPRRGDLVDWNRSELDPDPSVVDAVTFDLEDGKVYVRLEDLLIENWEPVVEERVRAGWNHAKAQ